MNPKTVRILRVRHLEKALDRTVNTRGVRAGVARKGICATAAAAAFMLLDRGREGGTPWKE